MRTPFIVAGVLATALAAGGAPEATATAVPPPPMVLPGAAAAASVDADPHTWLVGAKPSAAADRLVRRAGGTRILPGGFEVPIANARGVAGQLDRRGLLTFAEPNRYSSLAQRAVPTDPFDTGWRDAAIDPALVPPPVTPESPLLALVDSAADVTHPEFASGNATTLGGAAIDIAHGTQTMGTAVAPANGIGIVGAYPGARALNVPLPGERISCADSTRGIRRAVGAGAAVINMSYGATRFCNLEFQAIERAVNAQVVLVASAGNEGDDGNPFEFPGSLPHVLTVGALAPNNQIPSFSNTNAALDLVAPGVGIAAPTPPKFDRRDGERDGYEIVAGTSFSAPIVAAAALWLRTARPELTHDQVFQVIRLSATDIKKKGYDPLTGYGKLNLAEALNATPPIADPLEPNEDIPFVNGRVFNGAAAPLWSGGKPVSIGALLDYYEDPSDIYRLRVPAGARVRVTTNPDFGDPDIELFSGAARHIDQRRLVIAKSRHKDRRADQVSYRNRAGTAKTLFVRIFVRGRKSLDSRYGLQVK
jgi:hypothetical protein